MSRFGCSKYINRLFGNQIYLLEQGSKETYTGFKKRQSALFKIIQREDKEKSDIDKLWK